MDRHNPVYGEDVLSSLRLPSQWSHLFAEDTLFYDSIGSVFLIHRIRWQKLDRQNLLIMSYIHLIHYTSNPIDKRICWLCGEFFLNVLYDQIMINSDLWQDHCFGAERRYYCVDTCDVQRTEFQIMFFFCQNRVVHSFLFQMC